MIGKTARRGLVAVACAAFVFSCVPRANAQQPVTFQYFYDDLNQLIGAIDSTGVVLTYVYDSVGNMTQIKRSALASGTLTILNISPQSTPVGETLTIQGQGFSTTPGANIVMVGGVTATVLSSTPTTLKILVPANAASGTVTVTVAGVTAVSPGQVTIIPLPIISSVAPTAALAGTTISNFRVTGQNLVAAAFDFGVRSAIVSNVSIAPDGTSATLTVLLSPSVQGRLTLVATNAAGSSDPTVRLGFIKRTTGNTLTVPGQSGNADPDQDGVTNSQEIALGTDPLGADTDSDGWPDGLEALLKSDPLDPMSVPSLPANRYLVSGLTSLLNTASPGTSRGSKQYVSSRTFSILDTTTPASPAGSKQYLSGRTFSILDSTPPAPPTGSKQYVSSRNFSILVNTSPAVGASSYHLALSLYFSILNGTPSGGAPPQGSNMFTLEALRRRTAQPWLFPVEFVSVIDSDGDGIPDFLEIRMGTNPADPDTDHDGYPDGLELALGSDPLNPQSIPLISPPGFASAGGLKILNISQ